MGGGCRAGQNSSCLPWPPAPGLCNQNKTTTGLVFCSPESNRGIQPGAGLWGQETGGARQSCSRLCISPRRAESRLMAPRQAGLTLGLTRLVDDFTSKGHTTQSRAEFIAGDLGGPPPSSHPRRGGHGLRVGARAGRRSKPWTEGWYDGQCQLGEAIVPALQWNTNLEVTVTVTCRLFSILRVGLTLSFERP